MTFKELHIKTTSNTADEIANILLEFGAKAITFNDSGNKPILEPSKDSSELWPETKTIGLFDRDFNLAPILNQLNYLDIKVIDVPNKDWVRHSLDSFKPMKFGNKLWVSPSWDPNLTSEGINITLDPGLAFGTGSHATTALCLEWLEQSSLKNIRVIDYGCGSGILGIAAIKLGAKHVFAVDNDPEALNVTKDNFLKNNIKQSSFSTYLPEELPIIKADLVIANILFQPLVNLAKKLSNSTKAGGNILLSGILIDQTHDINIAYKDWYSMQKPILKEEWASLTGIRTNNI
ncbi:50S ribosomal protein L11 methyltransferase [Gammaproteobacteria bacterium]|nr:50S ribosomal protein L11 methyltransferase [Gammaproteobacteria bacterium]